MRGDVGVNDATTGVFNAYQGPLPVLLDGAAFDANNTSQRKFTKLVDGATAFSRGALVIRKLRAQAGCYTAAGVPGQDASDHQAILVEELRAADYHVNLITGLVRMDGVKTTLTNAVRVSRASVGMAPDASGVWASFGPGVPRLTTAGLLVEPVGSTNCIRNSQGAGYTVGTIGSGGAMPTNWSALNASGALYDVVGGGTEFGLPYVDVRFHGTASGSIYPTILFEGPSAGTGAAKADIWTASFYYRLTAGALPGSGLSSMGVDVLEYDSTGTYKGNGVGGYPVTPTASLQRAVYPRTLQQATTANVATGFTFNAAAGTVFDFTVRFYAPQVEKASTASSPIITAGAFATRAAETVTFAAPAGTYDLLISGPSSDTWLGSTAVPAGGWTPAATMTIKRVVTFRAGMSDAEQTWRSNALAAWTEPVSAAGARNAWGVVATAYQAQPGDKLLVDTSGGSFAIALPAAPCIGDPVELRDATGSWAGHPVTVNPSGAAIAGVTGAASLSTAWGAASYVFGPSGWTVR